MSTSIYDIRTPLVIESVEAARAAIKGIQDGSIEPKQANTLISGARALQSAVKVDLANRIAAPKLAVIEAKLIESADMSAKAIAKAA